MQVIVPAMSTLTACDEFFFFLAFLRQYCKNKLVVLTTEWLSSLEPRLSIPDFVSQLSDFSLKLRDKIPNGKSGFEASSYPGCRLAREMVVMRGLYLVLETNLMTTTHLQPSEHL